MALSNKKCPKESLGTLEGSLQAPNKFDYLGMSALGQAELLRIRANSGLDKKRKAALGQFFTPGATSLFMASLFKRINGKVTLLDPGCGPCTLTAAFVDEAVKRQSCSSIMVTAYDVERQFAPDVKEALRVCKKAAHSANIKFDANVYLKDFILEYVEVSGSQSGYSHVIMNPPYKKINGTSNHRKALRDVGIEAVNLYSGFVALAIQKLAPQGELVAIIPRSFCNGPYYQSFRQLLFAETAIRQIHIFDARNQAFSEDKVLQENIILHLVKGDIQKDITITSSPAADFHVDEETGTVTASALTTRTVPFSSVVYPNDTEQFIHIVANNRDQVVVNQMGSFTNSLDDLGISVSTGPVVDFRMREDLRQDIEAHAVPLLYPVHLNRKVSWPKQSNKPNAIMVSERTKPWLWRNDGYFVVVRRFSSKEEKRRIVATLYDSKLPGELIGFENKLNVFHQNKKGMDRKLAVGLYIYLNSTLLDKYYRLFGGHTQVNVTDLKNVRFPSAASLRKIGARGNYEDLTQEQIDNLIKKETITMTGKNFSDPISAQKILDQALQLLRALGLPRAQQNERSALTLLALLNLSPKGTWQEIERPMIGVTPIMNWCRDNYGKNYAPNTRETFRRQTLHQFVDGGLCLYNPDLPSRPVNSPKACYQLAPELFDTLKTYETSAWEKSLAAWLKNRKTLAAQYANVRKMEMIPLTLDDGIEISLSPGAHSQLIHDIVTEFGPRFSPGSQVIYLGDTEAKEGFIRKDRLSEFGVIVDRKGKMPDVVLYDSSRDWLLLIESVTSHGPVDGKRHGELATLFQGAKPGLVYVTAFPDKKIMGEYLSDISWETEVWVADAPTHLIHFNGDRFLGPH